MTKPKSRDQMVADGELCCRSHHYTCAASFDEYPPSRCCKDCPCYPEWGDSLTHPDIRRIVAEVNERELRAEVAELRGWLDESSAREAGLRAAVSRVRELADNAVARAAEAEAAGHIGSIGLVEATNILRALDGEN